MQAAFKAGELDRDCVVVVRGQGPAANGMPELHKLMPLLGVLQDRGFKVALVTDGRLSGASGKVLAAIHITPEAAGGGPLAKLRNGDVVRVDADVGKLERTSRPPIGASARRHNSTCSPTPAAWAGNCSRCSAPTPARPNKVEARSGITIRCEAD